jgi:hypothetical protein
MVRENLRVAQSRQKSYIDLRRRELSFEVGDFVYLKVSRMRGLCHFKVWGKHTKIHWTIQDSGEERWSSLPIGVAATVVWCAWCIPCVSTEEMVASAWRANTHRRFGCQGRPFLTRVPCQDFGDIRESYAEQEDQDVQGAMESPHRGRSYMGKRRRVEGRVSKFIFWSIRISGTILILRGVGLYHPDFHKEIKL